MTIYDSIILGIIEGFTEFLPISSTGHLIVASEFLGIEQNAINKAYEVIIQFSAILAVIFNYKDKFTIKKIDLWTKVFIFFINRFHIIAGSMAKIGATTEGTAFSSEAKPFFAIGTASGSHRVSNAVVDHQKRKLEAGQPQLMP